MDSITTDWPVSDKEDQPGFSPTIVPLAQGLSLCIKDRVTQSVSEVPVLRYKIRLQQQQQQSSLHFKSDFHQTCTVVKYV